MARKKAEGEKLDLTNGVTVVVGELTEGAAISLSLTKADDLVGPLAEPEDKIFFTSAQKGAELLMNEDNMLYMIQQAHKHCVCGGAPMDPDLVDRFGEFGITVVQGYGISDISEMMDLPEGTISSRLSRARKKLEEVLMKGGEEQ